MPISIAGSGAVTGASTLNGLAVPTDAIAPGTVLITSQSFNSTTSVSINNCFTSNYLNYRIIITARSANATTMNTLMRLRANGNDNTSSSYTRQEVIGYGTTMSASNVTTTSWGVLVGNSGNTTDVISMDILQPQASLWTVFLGNSMQYQTNVTQFVYRSLGGVFQGTNQFDGFSIIPDASTISGNIFVYGYRNA